MISLLITAFIMGGIGSMHCIGMCGPLALSLPMIGNGKASRLATALFYNAGRIMTYSVIGGLFGIIGMSFALFGYQQWLSVTSGVTIIMVIILGRKIHIKANAGLPFFNKIRKQLGRLFSIKNYRAVFFIGILNGLLPCGLVYVAITGAISTGSVLRSSLFMAAFGLGTLPTMWSVAFFGSYFNTSVRANIKRTYPYFMFFMAVLLIIRGMGLEIPYLSPSLHHSPIIKEKIISCHG